MGYGFDFEMGKHNASYWNQQHEKQNTLHTYRHCSTQSPGGKVDGISRKWSSEKVLGRFDGGADVSLIGQGN